MKKNLLLSLGMFMLCFSANRVCAQTSTAPYDFTYSLGNVYEELSSAATVAFDSTESWDDDTLSVPLPFSFVYNGDTAQNLIVGTNGDLYFTQASYVLGGLANLMVSNTDWVNQGQSYINYESTGDTGSRIFKVAYNNMALYYDDADTIRANFNFGYMKVAIKLSIT